MNKFQFKTAVLARGKEVHQRVIDDFQKEIRELKSSEMVINEGQFDHTESAMNDQTNARINELADQLNFAVDEMNLLNSLRIEEPLHDEVTLGSIVETDSRTFFVSVSIEDFEAEGKPLFGLSTKTPFYEAMAGMRRGDTFAYKGEQYSIRDIY